MHCKRISFLNKRYNYSTQKRVNFNIHIIYMKQEQKNTRREIGCRLKAIYFHERGKS